MAIRRISVDEFSSPRFETRAPCRARADSRALIRPPSLVRTAKRAQLPRIKQCSSSISNSGGAPIGLGWRDGIGVFEEISTTSAWRLPGLVTVIFTLRHVSRSGPVNAKSDQWSELVASGTVA